jgi:glycosyltransferase involved in cell wall biosynthesis
METHPVSNGMDITLVVCAYNEESDIAETIDIAHKVSRGRFREIIVVDNASTDRTAAIAQEHGARVVHEKTKGLTYARLAGLNATESEYIAYIDADTHLSDTWFDAAERIFAENPHIVALSGPRKYFGISGWRLAALNGFWLIAPLVYRIVGYMILGGNFIAKKSAIEDIGGFDTSIKFYGEDTDIARRLSEVGKVLFRSDFFVYASARRFEKEGVFKANIRYAVNYLWPVLFGKPYTVKYQDVR